MVVENTLRETGTVRRLSAAVLVDGIYQPGADGQLEYAPRTAQAMAKISALVSSAIGFDESRGVKREMVNMRLVPTEEEQMVAGTPDLRVALDRGVWLRKEEVHSRRVGTW